MNKYLLIIITIIFCTQISQASEPAKLSIYVIREGIPQKNKEIELNQKRVKTNQYGAVHIKVAQGKHNLILHLEENTIPIEITATENDRILIIASKSDSDSDYEILTEQAGQVSSPSSGKLDLSGPKGTLSGKIIGFEHRNPISNAKVYISGIKANIATDKNGLFTIELPEDIYTLSIVHNKFNTHTIRNVTIENNKKNNFNVELTPIGTKIEDYVVTAPAVAGSLLSLMDEQKNSSAVAEILSTEQMSQAGDSDAAGALKRVTGLTLVDGKFIYVRGLGERYSSVSLNGMSLPSPDPTRRVVPLDLFPTGMLESVLIQKTYMPNLDGDFAGGVVLLRSKSIPLDKVRKFSYTSGGHSVSSFQSGNQYDGGDYDYFGIDSGTRDLPNRLNTLSQGGRQPLSSLDPALIEEAGESLSNNYRSYPATLYPDLGLSINLANRHEQYNSNWAWGYNLYMLYKNKWRQKEQNSSTYALAGNGGLLPQDQSTKQKTENEIDLGNYLNLALEIGEEHKLQSNTLVFRKTTNTTLIDNAYLSENDITVRDSLLEWVERQLISQQFTGNHLLPIKNMELSWVASIAGAKRYEPDTRFYRYELINGGYQFSQEGQSNERSFEDLNDTTRNIGANLSIPLKLLDSKNKLSFGFNSTNKDRDSSFIRFRFLTDWSNNNLDPAILDNQDVGNILNDSNIGSDGYVLRNTTLPTDNYVASSDVTAFYLMTESEISEKLSAILGARNERSEQNVSTFQLTSPDQRVDSTLVNDNFLPAFGLTYKFLPKHQIRLAYSKTLNRPDFKELSEAPYIDPETRDVVIGNPLLQQSTVQNYDLRWEWYLTSFETLSIAAFYKQFDQPIERVVRLGAGGIHSFANVDSATNTGLEFQSRTWLSRFLGRRFSRYFIEANLAFIDSKVELGNAGAQQTSQNRPLQGQSPWVINSTLGYENQVAGLKANLLFNMIGDRITSVGTQGLPDAYEQAAPFLDFVISKKYRQEKIHKLSVKFKVSNVLNSKFEVRRGSQLEKSSNKGVAVKLSIQHSWK